ncbi:DDE-type integrase/transposase/recombinase [Massilia jejuensis]|uniref:DDE-type integrase/transposase/recombinase n=1 Tax=Massilia jejuensis TaxID=648894 RepID=A0ABW0PLF4_9BURK
MMEVATCGAIKAASDGIDAGLAVPIPVRRVGHPNNIVEQDRRAIKRLTRAMLGLQSFRSAGNVLAGIGFMHMTRKRQSAIDSTAVMSFADQFYSLAGQVRPE